MQRLRTSGGDGVARIQGFCENKNGDAFLPSWVDNNIRECRSWERVVCDPSTGRVNKLVLNDIWQMQTQTLGEDNRYACENGNSAWLLNVSIFLPVEELHRLNLSANSVTGFIENEGMCHLTPLYIYKFVHYCHKF